MGDRPSGAIKPKSMKFIASSHRSHPFYLKLGPIPIYNVEDGGALRKPNP